VYYISEMLSDSEILGLHARGDCYVSLDRGEGFGLCVGADTNILVPDGVKKAKDVLYGDVVLSKDGKFHKVNKTSKRYVSTALKISSKLHEDTIVSHEHPLFVTKNLSDWKRYNYNSDLIEKDLHWLEASKVGVNDYIAIPKPILDKELPNVLDILKYVKIENLITGDNVLSLKHGFSSKNNKQSYKNLVAAYGYTKKVFESAVKHLKNNSTPFRNTLTEKAHSLLLRIGYKIKTPNTVNRFVTLNDDVLSLFGWYLAEGSNSNGNAVEIDLHSNEYHVAEKLAMVFNKYFGVRPESIYLGKSFNKARLVVSSAILANLFESLFGKGAFNKHFPSWLFLSGRNLLPVLRSLFEGDGYDSGSIYQLATVSPNLAYQTKILLNNFGMCPRIKMSPAGELGNYPRYKVTIANKDYERFTEKNISTPYQEYFVETDNYFLVKVTKIAEIEYNDYMYDFTVDASESFVGNGLLMHNCPFQAGATGNPIIVTGFGGVTEYAKPDNSMLVNFSLTPVFGMPWSPWYRGDQLWAEPDVLHAVQKMQWAYEHQDEAKLLGGRLKAHIADNFTWEHIGKRIIKELQEI
jgi:intein/homing endonuclease